MKKWKIGWGPISSCNMNCEFCYSKKTRSQMQLDMSELKLEHWIDFIDQNSHKIDSVNYGTGENSMSDDWFELVAYIRSNYPEIKQAVTTNGYLSERVKNNSRYEKIIKSSIDEIDISLDFSDPDKHNHFRGQKNGYSWAINTLKLCKESNILGTIVFLGTDRTLDINNIDGLFSIGEKYGAKLRMNIYRPTNGINDMSKQFIASYENIISALYHIDSNYKILAICDPLFNSILTDGINETDPSGVNSLRILSDGSITPSTYLIGNEFRKANIKDENVLENIENNGTFEKFAQAPIPSECTSCAVKSKCKGGVFDRRYLWYADLNQRDPYCPLRMNYSLPERKLNVPTSKNFQSVHDGYLPTMFFSAT